MEEIPYECKYCNVTCSSARTLDEHVVGTKHRLVLAGSYPELVPQINSLQLFLDMHEINEPLLGLQYIVETQWGNISFHCELCDIRTNRKHVLSHIIGPLHTKNYLDRHHPEHSEYINQLRDNNRKRALRSAAILVHRQHGPKRLQGHVDISVSKEAKLNLKKREAQSQETISTKRLNSRTEPCPPQETQSETSSEHQATEMEENQNKIIQPLRNNDGFMDYLRNFEIQNDEDASFVREIAQNCITALMKFREELVNEEGSQGSLSSGHPALANTEGTDQHGLDTISNSFSSVAKCGQLGAVPERGVVDKRDATEICSSI